MTSLKGLRPGCKVWLEKDGVSMGEGLYNLLTGIDRAGSITAAALEMGMSYRAAWGKIRTAEKRWQTVLVRTRVGGDAGGGASLTGEARALVDLYRELRQGADRLINQISARM